MAVRVGVPMAALLAVLLAVLAALPGPAAAQIYMAERDGGVVLSNFSSDGTMTTLVPAEAMPIRAEGSGSETAADPSNPAPMPYPAPAQAPVIDRDAAPATATRPGPPPPVPAALRGLIERVGREQGVAPALLAAVAAAESGFDPRAVSPRGARGLMQLMPATARELGVRRHFSADDSLRGGAAYLKSLISRFGGDLPLALAAYNAGEGTVRRAGDRIPDIQETRLYVPRVLAWHAHYARRDSSAASAGLSAPRHARPHRFSATSDTRP